MVIAELVLKYIQALAWPLVTLGLAWVLRGQIRGAFARMTRLETPAGAIDFAAEVREVLVQADAAAGVAGSGGPPFSVGSGNPYASVGEPSYGGYGSTGGDGRPQPPYEEAPGGGSPQPQPAQPETQPRGGGAPPVPPPYGRPGPLAPAPDEYPIPAPYPYPSPRPVFGGLREARELVSLSPARAVISAWNTLNDFCVEVILRRSGGRPVSPRGTEIADALKAAGLSRESVAVLGRLTRLRNRAAHDADTVTARAALDFLDTCQKMADLVSEELLSPAY
ncbi:hypothetical protein QR77_22230 [Streptomyces sp. 150FB]|uniref:hypothetical protein n=1 Tax=Streptomyces sp. 150FB TaxID=1576605 RepID=UPI000591A098|nr:hypothetical protein [Streptomyces sp. 150FB]KIF75872.1 hypothetical protein QR77_22230 [Streptomyces sp. 150FB]